MGIARYRHGVEKVLCVVVVQPSDATHFADVIVGAVEQVSEAPLSEVTTSGVRVAIVVHVDFSVEDGAARVGEFHIDCPCSPSLQRTGAWQITNIIKCVSHTLTQLKIFFLIVLLILNIININLYKFKH